ncbi:lipopolysaccharide transport periplasmic protein LptA [Halopseudomonas laoshanensis]|uniref:Lipopolysaccharide export system protein LptA n=2 Tax=Halopseudomonas laoshanensis TaxID=2268758 RepID=A0A7V7KVE9_9GAMM|nr:lipopolysaccharide transport periplasmic protein LptA [Halopseudomonas laoshanensis]
MRCVKSLGLAALVLGLGMSAATVAADRDQPIRIQANSATLDDRSNTAVYTGNVIITQGSMRLTGNRVTLNTDAEGAVSKIVSQGTPATYKQTPEGGSPVDSRGQTIEYLADADRVVLIDDAFLEQDGNTFQGEYISYDITREVVDAGRANSNGGTGGEQDRIEILIQPRKRSEPATP